MKIEVDILVIKQKALNLIPEKDEDKFNKTFDDDIAFDLIENTEDYLAEGVAGYFLNNCV